MSARVAASTAVRQSRQAAAPVHRPPPPPPKPADDFYHRLIREQTRQAAQCGVSPFDTSALEETIAPVNVAPAPAAAAADVAPAARQPLLDSRAARFGGASFQNLAPAPAAWAPGASVVVEKDVNLAPAPREAPAWREQQPWRSAAGDTAASQGQCTCTLDPGSLPPRVAVFSAPAAAEGGGAGASRTPAPTADTSAADPSQAAAAAAWKATERELRDKVCSQSVAPRLSQSSASTLTRNRRNRRHRRHRRALNPSSPPWPSASAGVPSRGSALRRPQGERRERQIATEAGEARR